MNSVDKIKRQVHPQQRANFLSIATFIYMVPTFLKGYKNGFEENDIYQILPRYQSEMLGNKIERLWNNELKACKTNRTPSLVRVLIRAFGLEYLLSGLMIAIVELFTKPMQAVFLGRLILFYMPANDTHITKSDAYLYAIGIIFCTLAKIIIFHPFILKSQLTGLKAKIACCSLIYRKALKLNNAAFNKTSVGQMVNLISNDVMIFIRCAMLLNFLWLGPAQCVVITCLMYKEVGFSSIVGILSICLCIPIYYFLGRATSKYRLKVALRSDKRVTYMNEIILGIKVIKMYVWEKPIEHVLFSLRKLEMKHIRIASYIRATFYTFDISTIPIILYVTIIVYNSHTDITADKVFALTVFYNVLRICMVTFFPQALALLSESLVSIDRVTNFLLNTEVKFESIKGNSDLISISIMDATAKWKSEVTLNNISLSIKRGSLVAVIGPVGCGKSSLLSIMLRELPLESGILQINGRISYASQDPWLFGGTVRDNILFGEKMNVPRYIEVVRRCALERDFKLLPFADDTMVGGRGSSLSGGQKARINLARAIYRDSEVYLLDEPFSAVDSRVGSQIFQECIKDYLKDKTVILVTHQLKYLTDVDEVIVLESGTIQSQGKWKEYNSEETTTNEENNDSITTKYTGGLVKQTTEKTQEIVKEQKSTGTVSNNVYMDYINSGGNVICLILIFLLLLVTQAFVSGSSYFISHWVNRVQLEQIYDKENSVNVDSNNNFTNVKEFQSNYKEIYTYIYTIITAVFIILAFTRSYMFYTLCLRSSAKLHNNMFKSVIHATMRFFNTNSQGRIINRFAQDMGTVDNLLPSVAMDTIQLLLSTTGSCVLIAITNYWLIIPTIIIALMMYFLNRFCLHTTRAIKRLEGVTRSPVFEHLSSSVQGLSTIRAFQAQEKLKEGFDSHQDLHSCCFHLFATASRTLGYYLECVCSMYVVIVTLSFVIFDHGVLGGVVGLAITQCLTVTGHLQWVSQQVAEIENNMTSVERILEYNSIEQESKLDKYVRTNWLEDGGITFCNVFLKYSVNDPPVLKNVSFKIAPKEKIGIIGRTGAGKTSIINAIFRLSYLSGSILIDNIDITNLSLQELRSKISIIPQDPVLFTGTLRYNLDPFEEWDDNDIWIVLEEVELKNAINMMPLGLDTVMSQSGSNISVGQRQLLCLARAILRNNKILVLDEATASVDSETDALIQKTIRRKFKDCTILTIAHRIDTIMDSDKILVMSAGEVMEFDKPSVLLENSHGYFYQMAKGVDKCIDLTTKM